MSERAIDRVNKARSKCDCNPEPIAIDNKGNVILSCHGPNCAGLAAIVVLSELFCSQCGFKLRIRRTKAGAWTWTDKRCPRGCSFSTSLDFSPKGRRPR